MGAERVSTSADDTRAARSGLLGLAIIARYHGLTADPEELRRRFVGPDGSISFAALRRGAAYLGLKTRAVTLDWRRLSRIPLPALVVRRDGRCLILVRADESRVLVQEPGTPGLSVLGRTDLEAVWAGRGLLIGPTRDTGAKMERLGWSWFVPHVLRHRLELAHVLVASIVLQVFALLTPLATQVVIDKVLVHRGLGTLDVIAAGLLALILFEIVLSTVRAYLFAHTANRIDVELGARVFGHALRLPLGYFETRRAGDTVARIRELEAIRQFLTGPPLTAIVDTLFTVVFLAVMLIYSLTLTGVVVGVLPLYALLTLVVTPPLRRAMDDRAQRGADAHSFLVETVRGIETVKATAVEPLLERRWDEHLAAMARASFRAGQIAQTAGQIAGMLGKLVSLGVLWIGARAAMAGELTIGELIAFNMFAARVTAPVLRLFQLGQEWQQATVGVGRIADLLACPAEAAASRAAPPVARLRGSLEFDTVSFAYRAGTPEVLSKVSFTIAPGETVSLVGASGSGKSTIAKLTARLYLPQQGRILVDGLDVGLFDPAWLRRQVAVVPQETTLFTGSVRENIAWADPGLPMGAVIDAARQAGAHEFITALPGGYETPVGEHGALLSGGQRQRIGMARALVMRPSILILDEATSALDYESERLIARNLGDICKGRTVVIITHRTTLVHRTARVIVLAGGRIIEDGRPADLLARDGYFAALDREQRALGADDPPYRSASRSG
jgi:subfamily B ATP-binding cassette protein HlyB/CyaB